MTLEQIVRNVPFLFEKAYENIILTIELSFRWPGSVHDARVLRTSPLFTAFEENPPVTGIILGDTDSAYMLRSWLVTPLLRPATAADRRFNFAHCSTRCTVEGSIGVAKQRWRCLRNGLRLAPRKAWRVIMVCCMLHNRARLQSLPDPPPPPPPEDARLNNNEEDDDDDDDEAGNAKFEYLYIMSAQHFPFLKTVTLKNI